MQKPLVYCFDCLTLTKFIFDSKLRLLLFTLLSERPSQLLAHWTTGACRPMAADPGPGQPAPCTAACSGRFLGHTCLVWQLAPVDCFGWFWSNVYGSIGKNWQIHYNVLFSFPCAFLHIQMFILLSSKSEIFRILIMFVLWAWFLLGCTAEVSNFWDEYDHRLDK